MTLPVSLVLIAAGAILVWGVTTDTEGLNVDAIGVVLMVVGLLGFVLSLIFWDRSVERLAVAAPTPKAATSAAGASSTPSRLHPSPASAWSKSG